MVPAAGIAKGHMSMLRQRASFSVLSSPSFVSIVDVPKSSWTVVNPV